MTDRISYTEEKMNNIKLQVQKLIGIVNELEADFPGRHFTLDGQHWRSYGGLLLRCGTLYCIGGCS